MERKEFTLVELNGLVRASIKRSFPDTCWLRAETSDVRINSSSGHCYLEFVEKDPRSGQILAKARGSIWSRTFQMIRPYFEGQTGQRFASGMKVLVKVSVDFHELYGFGLTVHDIDPSYTLGDMARQRQEIIKKLQEEGILTLNKELELPTLVQRIAIVTSPTAAGYEDFLNQLHHNKQGYKFYTKLYPAIMQGDKTASSVIEALDKICLNLDDYDAVVIIRGGGATSELNAFDNYELAANCAQFPLPLITGIGHERDDTVIDLVANVRAKTPTAVAEFLIGRMSEAEERMLILQQRLLDLTTIKLTEEKGFLQAVSARLPGLVQSWLHQHNAGLQLLQRRVNTASHSFLADKRYTQDMMVRRLPDTAFAMINKGKQELAMAAQQMKGAMSNQIVTRTHELGMLEQFVQMASPDYILKRGYTITVHEGKIVKNATDLKQGDQLVTRFKDGEVTSIVES